MIGFSAGLKPRIFTEHARFYLLPELPLPILRYAAMLASGTLIACWLIVRRRVQVLVAQSPYEGFVAAAAKRMVGWMGYRVALVVETHSDFEKSLFMQRRLRVPELYRLLMRFTATFALKHADAFRAISNSTRRQLETWMPGKPIVQFPAWTDMEVFLKEGLRKKAGLLPQEILCTGVLIPRKGIHHLIEAFVKISEEFPASRLVIIGHPENKEYATALTRQVEELCLNERVLFLRPKPQSELAQWMTRAKMFVLPSLSEGLGRVIFEAMASGTPVIGSDVDGIPDMIENGVTGFLVPPGDEGSLADKIRWLLKHPRETEAMGQRARAVAEQLFSTERFIGGYRELFAITHNLVSAEG